MAYRICALGGALLNGYAAYSGVVIGSAPLAVAGASFMLALLVAAAAYRR